VTLAGGNLVLSSNLVVGTTLISTGQVSVVGGRLDVTNATGNGYMLVSQGALTLAGGTLNADNFFLTNATGQFLFNAGVLQSRNMTVSNGAPFVVGDGSQPAALVLQGGVFNFAGGLVISSNASVTGCGTIVGAITNNGTLATNCGAPAGIVITSIRKTNSVVTIRHTSLAGQNHLLEFKDSFASQTWTPVSAGVSGSGNEMTQLDSAATATTRFYRIRIGTALFSPVITAITKTGSVATISFTTQPGATYFIERKDLLASPAWTTILPGITGNGGVMSAPDNNATSSTRFYCVRVQ
jgi:hypothetical protein